MQLPKKRILCVDNDKDTCEMMEALLGIWDYEVAVARTAVDGLRQAQSHAFDLYLLDTHLPDVSGPELCEQICGITVHAPVVFISGAT
jgi:DNA-binding response OmpR family regulator